MFPKEKLKKSCTDSDELLVPNKVSDPCARRLGDFHVSLLATKSMQTESLH